MPQNAKRNRRPIDILSRDEVLALIGSCSRRAPTGRRNACLLALLWRCGLRISEALSLAPKDIDVEQGVLRVHSGKGNKSRVLGLDSVVSPYLDRWLDTRKKLGLSRKKSAPLICTLKGGPVSSAYARSMLARRAAKTGTEKRVHCHGLRHAFAAERAAETTVHRIQKELGHSSLAITNVYLDHIRPEDVIAGMRARS